MLKYGARVRAAPSPLKVIAPRIKLAKVRCAPHRSQKGHRSAGGANVLKLVGRGARTKTAKVLRTPYVKDPPVAASTAPRRARAVSCRYDNPIFWTPRVLKACFVCSQVSSVRWFA